MRKFALILVVLLVVGAASASSWAIGGIFNIGLDLPSSAMLLVKAPSIPVMWGVGFQASGEGVGQLGITADWWLYQTRLTGALALYVGPGLYLAAPELEIGGRVPIGIQVYPLDVFEVFIELAPTLTIVSQRGIDLPSFGFQGGVGFRFWF
jgi:hypothetical protein